MSTVANTSMTEPAVPQVQFPHFSIRRAYSAIRQWNLARKTRNSLLKLSDHELNDIGFVRGDVDNLAYHAKRKN